MWGLIRDLFSAIDSSIYSFITYIYRILMNIADVQIFSQESLKTFSERVYALLAIFMAFKLIFSFINYAVNPDQLSNEKTGGKKLVLNIMISLILLIAVPGIIFPLSRRLQYAILDEGVLQEIILGVDQGAYSQSRNTLRAGRSMSYSVFTSFFTPNPPATKDAGCTDETLRFFDNGPGNCDGGECANSEDGIKNLRYQLDGRCAKAINDALEGTDVDAEKVVTTYERAYNQFSTKILLGGDGDYNLKRIKTKDGEFLFDYKILLSTVAGIAVGWMLVVFCFQIAVRTIKLGFLELVAPIPILSYIDTKAKSKSFDGWVKSCISAYLDLFVRLAALYFAIFVISSISLGDLTYASESFKTQGGTGESVGLVVKFFIIMGALMFAQQVPKLIEDIFGIKLDGKFSLNPFKDSPFAAKALGGAVGLAGGAALGLAANAANVNNKLKANRELKAKLKAENGGTLPTNYKQDEGYQRVGLNNYAGVLGGFFSGGARSMIAGYKSKNGIKGTVQGVTASSRSRNLRETGYSAGQRALNAWTDMAGMPNVKTGTTDTYDSETKKLKQQLAYVQQSQAALSQAESNMRAQNATALSGIVNIENGSWGYDSYGDYEKDKIKDVIAAFEKTETFENAVEAAGKQFKEGTAEYNTELDKARNIAVEDARKSGKIASEELYNNYEQLHKDVITSRDASIKIQKQITRREEVRAKDKK